MFLASQDGSNVELEAHNAVAAGDFEMIDSEENGRRKLRGTMAVSRDDQLKLVLHEDMRTLNSDLIRSF